MFMEYDHKEHPKTVAPDDFWGQVKRTINGKPVSDEQIQMIIDAITSGLALNENDVVLDLACGNGALSDRYMHQCAGLLGVDFSEYLISVAKKYFESFPKYQFALSDAESYVRNESQPERFSKVLCYGSFSYFPDTTAQSVLKLLHDKFSNVERVYIGNLPDLNRCEKFFYDGVKDPDMLKDPESKIGIWRTEQEFRVLAEPYGWNVEFRNMPEAFYAHHYRYDVVLRRQK